MNKRGHQALEAAIEAAGEEEKEKEKEMKQAIKRQVATGGREASSVVTGRLKLALAWPIVRLKLSSPMR